jgi:hypothetical protein
MDTRQTLVVHASFLQILHELKELQQKASHLIDDNGLCREEGFITQIIEEDKSAFIHLSNGKTISLQAIVAVNGIFLSDYSEC